MQIKDNQKAKKDERLEFLIESERKNNVSKGKNPITTPSNVSKKFNLNFITPITNPIPTPISSRKNQNSGKTFFEIKKPTNKPIKISVAKLNILS